MRIAALVAVPLLVAGCAHDVDSDSGRSQTSTPATPSSSVSSSTSKLPTASKVPSAGAPISEVIAWIEAGHAADPARYHSVTREDVTTELGDDIAFSAQGGKVSCLTDTKHTGDAMACLVSLTNPSPPPPPPTANGRAAGSILTAPTCGSGPPEATRDRSPTATGPSWPTATRCRSATTVAEPIRPAFFASTTPISPPLGSAAPASSRSAACGRCRRPTVWAPRSAAEACPSAAMPR